MLDGKVSNKDRPKQLSQSLIIGFSLLEMSNLKRKGILDLPNIHYLCAILPFILINSEPNFHRCTDGGSMYLCICVDDVCPFITLF